jgi:hypothetical protein
MSPTSTRDIGTASDLNRNRNMSLEKAARRAFFTWACTAQATTPWEYLSSREQQAWRDLIVDMVINTVARCAECNTVLVWRRCL